MSSPCKGMGFVDWCVRALLDGTKTQTMRIVSAKKMRAFEALCPGHTAEDFGHIWAEFALAEDAELDSPARELKSALWKLCDYQPGQVVYVKEALRRVPLADMPERPMPTTFIASYAADDGTVIHCKSGSLPQILLWRKTWTRSYLHNWFMPREAARLWRRILTVRAMQVQETTEDEVVAEGIDETRSEEGIAEGYSRLRLPIFAAMWDALHAKPGTRWEDNPYVYRYTFEPTEAPE